MAKEKVEALIEGGKASAAPPLGPALGPLGINIGEVVAKINEKTAMFKGMKVPVKVIVDKSTKQFEIEVGTPPVSQLIKKELRIETGSGTPNMNKLGNLAIEQVIKIALMKKDSMLVKELKAAVKSVIGACHSMGVLVEGKNAVDINKDVDSGVYDKEIKQSKTDVSPEKQRVLAEQLAAIQDYLRKELEKLKALEAAKEGEKKEEEGEVAAAEGEVKEEKKEEKKIEKKAEKPEKTEKPAAEKPKK